jgi:hypothetical protein
MTITWPQIAAAVYQACTTYDQYLPQLSPDVARSWSKAFAYYNLSVEDLIAGVDKVYISEGAGYRPLPADITKAAREIRKERAEREGWAELEARQDVLSRKAAEEVRAVAIAFDPGHVEPTKRLEAARDRLDSCQGRHESQSAIHEFFAAKRAAKRGPTRTEMAQRVAPANVLSVPCSWCNASIGQHCVVPQTNDRPDGGAHPSRIEAAEATAAHA